MREIAEKIKALSERVADLEKHPLTPVGETAGDAAYYRPADGSLRPPGDVYVSGDVGIGTSSPAEKLDVRGTTRMVAPGGGDGTLLTAVSEWFTLSRETGHHFLAWWAKQDGKDWKGTHSSIPPARVRSVGGLRVETAANVGVGGTIGTWTTRFIVENDGNAGIGTSSPQNPLGYGRILNISGFAPGLVLTESDTDTDWTVGVNAQDLRIYEETDLRFIIANGGNVGIGTGSPAEELHVVGGAQFDRNLSSFIDLKVPASGDSTDRARIEWSGADFGIRNIDGSTLRVGIGTNSPGAILDVVGGSALHALLPAASSAKSFTALDNNQWTLWFDGTGPNLVFQVKDGSGSTYTGTLALT